MIQIRESLIPFETFASFLGYEPENTLFFDIETTGLSPASSAVFLIGTIHSDSDGWILSQYMAESLTEEPELIRLFFSHAQKFRTLIHYNGSSFDLPYLKQKAEQYEFPNPLITMDSIDLYQKFRSLKTPLLLEHMNQTALEPVVSYRRTDRLTGKHMIELFHKYAASKNSGILNLLLLHNHDDLVGMTRILHMSLYQMLPDLILEAGSLSPADDSALSDIKQHFPDLQDAAACYQIPFTLKAELPAPYEAVIDRIYYFSLRQAQGVLTIPAYSGEMRYFFKDYKNYYYLPLEDQAIHKSIGAYVDRTHRKAATPKTCYTRKTSCFLPQPDCIFQPSFRNTYESGQQYFEYTAETKTDHEHLLQLIKLALAK